MRSLIFIKLYLVLTFSVVTSFAQKNTKLISQIRKEFNIINSDKTFTKITLAADEFLDNPPDGGGELTGFYKGGELRKIIRWIGLSNGNETLEFYFKNNGLIFVYEEFRSFVYDSKKQELRFDSTEKTFIGRYYFDKNKLVHHITTGHNRFENDTINPEKTLLIEAEENRELLDRKKSKSR